MKRSSLVIAGALVVLSAGASGQDLAQHDVPAQISSQFKNSFSKAKDIEWEKEGDRYKVEFELGFPGRDHEVWYNDSARVVRREDALRADELPPAITAKIKSDYPGYHTDDIKKITEDDKVSYAMDLESGAQEWKMSFDEKGNIIEKIAD